jgi:hypothetical protein
VVGVEEAVEEDEAQGSYFLKRRCRGGFPVLARVGDSGVRRDSVYEMPILIARIIPGQFRPNSLVGH